MKFLNYILLFFIVFNSSQVYASDLGMTGLIDIPTARMMNDGDIKATFSSQKIANITNITYQATPWLETTFRYTIFNPDNPLRNSYNIDGLSDRSYAAKFRLKKESNIFPEIAIGLQDIVGTGAWSSEYLVASKQYNDFDFTLGMGWGRLSERESFGNPLAAISQSYEKRGSGGGQKGGKLRLSSFFTGEKVGLFGGVSYKIPNSRLKILIEYNSDAYEREIKLFTINDSSPLSYGVEWESPYNLSLGFSRQQKNQWAFSVSSRFNTKKLLPTKNIAPYYSSLDKKGLSLFPKSLNYDVWYDRLFFDLDKSGILMRSAKLLNEAKEINIEISNNRYVLTADAIKRVLTLSQIHLPKNIKHINIIVNEGGIQVMTVSYFRNNNFSDIDEFRKSRVRILPARINANPTYQTGVKTPHINFNANLAARFQLFDPDTPLKHQLFLNLRSVLTLPMGWNLIGSLGIDINNNFDINSNSASALPKVRTDIDSYLTEGSTGISSLYLEKRASLNSQLYYRLYLGVLEDMYSGFGGELLYNPFKSRWAIGSTVNSLQKRGFERDFSLKDYKTVSRFVSLYYASGFYNYDFALHLGRYLAKDEGGTLEVRRTFDNGFSVGAFATRTNVSASDFGEGSFDKGLYFKMPFNNFSNFDSKNSFATILRSIQRDGGQKLDDFTGRLWHDLRNVRYDSFNNNRLRMVPK